LSMWDSSLTLDLKKQTPRSIAQARRKSIWLEQ
jgi:hypothetical protein